MISGGAGRCRTVGVGGMYDQNNNKLWQICRGVGVPSQLPMSMNSVCVLPPIDTNKRYDW